MAVARALLAALATIGWSAPAAAAAPAVDPAPGAYAPPVDAPVVDGFRPPAHIGAPGNRGWEYATEAGQVVRAAGSGVVAFAGPIGSRLYVSIAHPDGLRTTYSWVASIEVSRGRAVGVGERIATTGSVFHFGVRCGASYLDPIVLFGAGLGPPRPRLVPVSVRRTARVTRRWHGHLGAQRPVLPASKM